MILDRALPTVLESTAVVRFQDCDPFGHLNNARYVEYFMDARTDQLQAHYDFDIFGVGQETGSNWVVSKTEIVFLRPALLREKIRIETRLIEATTRKLVVEGVMRDASGKQIKSIAWVEFTFVSLANGRPANHTEALMQLFNTVKVDAIYENMRFDERVANLRAIQREQRRSQPRVETAVPN